MQQIQGLIGFLSAPC